MRKRNTGRSRTHRTFVSTLVLLAVSGWSGVAYLSWSAARTERALRSEVAQLKTKQAGAATTGQQPRQEVSSTRTVYPAPNAAAQAVAVAPTPATGALESAASPASAVEAARPEQTPASAPVVRQAVTQPSPSTVETAMPASQPNEGRFEGGTGESKLTDINTASVDELNRLGGRFGRAIVAGRPYATVDELVTKRVLTKGTFAQIKDQITAN